MCDHFSVRIELDCVDPRDGRGYLKWRTADWKLPSGLASRSLTFIFYSNGSCCLGQLYHPEPHLTIDRFMTEVVSPFFYRLSYVSKYGIEAPRSDLWGEYSHGDAGYYEHRMELRRIASQRPGRNDACPCGGGRKYMRCHLDEVEAFMRDLQRSRRARQSPTHSCYNTPCSHDRNVAALRL